MRPLLTALGTALLLLPLAGGQEARRVHRLWTKADLFDAAAAHAGRLAKPTGVRYFDLAAVAPRDRPAVLQGLSYALNSLSRSDLIALPAEVPNTEGALAYIDLKLLGIDPRQLDRLGELGSGPAPFPEPFYHAAVESESEYEAEEPYSERRIVRSYSPQYGGYVERVETVNLTRKVTRKRKSRSVALAPHLSRASAIGIVEVCKTQFPVFDARWFIANALSEPRYHEILGLDDSEDSVKKLAAVDERTADRVGAQVRGAVLISEVAHRNRFLERTPTPLRYGKGTYQESYDFNKSVRGKNVLKDLLLDEADAHEIIWTLPNGLLGFFVTDGKGKRLDVAVADVALNNRGKWLDRQVRTAIMCIHCHLPERGWIEVDDEVRSLSKKPVELVAAALDKEKNPRGVKIRQKYLDADFNELLRADQLVVDAAVKAATKGPDGKSLSCPDTAKVVSETARVYLEVPVPLAQLALELGYPQDDVALALRVKGIDPVFAVIAGGRRGRRDQVEEGFAQLATILYKGGYK